MTIFPNVPAPEELDDDELPGVLDQFDGREVLHVTYGSVLTAEAEDGSPRFRERILAVLEQDEEAHYDALVKHIGKHVAPFGSD